MQNKASSKSGRFPYLALGTINACVAVMFVAILWPHPPNLAAIAYASPAASEPHEGPTRKPITGTATRIQIPSVGIDTAVRPGDYDAQSKTWALDTASAFYATMTVPVNNANGTTLIYGHAGWGVFEALPAVTTGAEARVATSEGRTFIYAFQSSRQVDPSDVSSLVSTGPPLLIVQTCSGAFDSFRTLVTFRLIGVVLSV